MSREGRSLGRDHFDAWTNGMGTLAARWMSAYAGGAIASGIAIWLFVLGVSWLLPSPFDLRSRNLPMGVYGALIGLVIGGGQALALGAYLRNRIVWTLGTAVAAGAGFQLGSAVANRVDAFVPGYFGAIILLGALVGIAQSVLLQNDRRATLRWTLWSAFAVPAGILCGTAAVFLFRVPHPGTWLGAVSAFALLPAVIGLAIGALTVQPLTKILAGRETRA